MSHVLVVISRQFSFTGTKQKGEQPAANSEDDYRSGCRNISHCHQQFFSELHQDDHTRQTTDTPGFKPATTG